MVKKEQARGLAKLVAAIEQHNELHPEDCDESGRWVRNLPNQNDTIEYKDAEGKIERYSIGNALVNLKQGGLNTTPELLARLDSIIDFSGKRVGELRESYLLGKEKLIAVIKLHNAIHKEDCDELGRWGQNFPTVQDFIYLRNQEGKVVKYSLGRKMYSALSHSSNTILHELDIKKYVDCDKYQQQKSGPKTKRTKLEMQQPPQVYEVDNETFEFFEQTSYTQAGINQDLQQSVSLNLLKSNTSIKEYKVLRLEKVIKQYNACHPENCDEAGRWAQNFPVTQEIIYLRNKYGELIEYKLGAQMYKTAFSQVVEYPSVEIGKLVDWENYRQTKNGPRCKRTREQIIKQKRVVLDVDDETFKLFTQPSSIEEATKQAMIRKEKISPSVSAVLLLLQKFSNEEIDELRDILNSSAKKGISKPILKNGVKRNTERE